MTALLSTGAENMTFICDGCGSEETARQASRDSEMVWPLVSSLGWTGSAFATGKHLCPRCSDTPPPAAAPDTSKIKTVTCDVRVLEELDTAVLTPRTDLDATTAEALKDTLATVLHANRTVLVDLRVAAVIDSAGLSLLVRAHQTAKQNGGALLLAAPSRYVLTVLHTMRLDGVFETYPDTDTALKTIRARNVKALSPD